MKFSWRTEWPLWALLVAMFALAAVTWSHAPERIPIHWDLRGEVNGYAGRFGGLLGIPLVALALYLMFLIMPRFDPHRANYAQFAGTYTIIRFSILMVLALVYGAMHLWLRGHRPPLTVLAPVLVGCLFIVFGSVMGKLRPNWFVGFRTPWTLTSERSWTRTHVVAGKVFILIGVCMIAASLLRSNAAFIATVAIAIVGILGTIAYSYFAWRDDPDRTPLSAGHPPAR